MATNKNPRSYLAPFIAALIVIAAALSFFVYSLVFTTPEEIEPFFIDKDSSIPAVNPGNVGPSAPPSVPFPTTPPPSPATP